MWVLLEFDDKPFSSFSSSAGKAFMCCLSHREEERREKKRTPCMMGNVILNEFMIICGCWKLTIDYRAVLL